MPNSSEIPWKRLAIESAAIVASILLAFAIDAWWAERSERIAERETLSRLHAEFASNRARLNSWISDEGFMSQALASSLAVSEILQTAIQKGAETASVLDMQIAALARTATFEAETPVYEGLVTSGRIEIIENRAIVSAIASWDRQLQNAYEIERSKRQFVNGQLIPALMARSNIQHVLMNRFGPTQVAPIDPNKMTDIDIDHPVVNLVGERYFWAAIDIRALAQLRDSADLVMIEISKSLEQ